jgi:hypothetical protein
MLCFLVMPLSHRHALDGLRSSKRHSVAGLEEKEAAISSPGFRLQSYLTLQSILAGIHVHGCLKQAVAIHLTTLVSWLANCRTLTPSCFVLLVVSAVHHSLEIWERLLVLEHFWRRCCSSACMIASYSSLCRFVRQCGPMFWP